MPLIKWEPLLPDFDKFFEDFNMDFPKGLSKIGKFVPDMDMYEDQDGSLKVEVSVPKMKPEDINLEMKDNHLLISGKTEHKTEVSEDKFYRKEIQTGSFKRVVRLPQTALVDEISAEHEDGLLTITIPQEKIEEKKEETKKIDIKSKKK